MKPPQAAGFASNLQEYVREVSEAYQRFEKSRFAPAFIAELRAINEEYIPRFAEIGYADADGVYGDTSLAGQKAVRFINGFLTGFEGDMLADPNKNWRWRALMYPAEANRLAFVLGQQQAMKERGARAWRRILHPELSEAGPCDLCIADAAITHSIDDDFQLLHPGDVCSMMETIAYFPSEPTQPQAYQVEMPVPERPSIPGVIQMLMDSIADLGKTFSRLIRRVRNE